MLQTIRVVDGASLFQNDSMKANIRPSLAKVLTEHAVLVMSGFELAPRPGTFTGLISYFKFTSKCLVPAWLLG